MQDRIHLAEASQRVQSGIRTRLTLLSLFVCLAVVAGFELTEKKEDEKAKAEEAAGKSINKADESVLLDVFVVGVIGGCFSTLLRVQRFQISGTESFHRLTSLPWNALLIVRSLLLGGLGAVVLYVIMRSQIVPLPFFPAFKNEAIPKDALDSIFSSPVDGPEMAAKLYICCFLAGFSERLVPDALTRITAMAKEDKGQRN